MPYKDPLKSLESARLRQRKYKLKEGIKEKERTNRINRYATKKQEAADYNKEYIRKNHDKYQARYILNNALLRGEIKKGPCDQCGTTIRITGHHSDYSKPLDVVWLCYKCHMERDKGKQIISNLKMANERPYLLFKEVYRATSIQGVLC